MTINDYIRPKTLDEAYQHLQSDDSRLIAGGAWLKLSLKKAEKLIALDDLSLNQITQSDQEIEIGAMVTLRQLETNALIQDCCDGILAQAAGHIMGVGIRNIATIGGSVMGKFAFSDLLPVLRVMDTRLVFFHQGEMSLEAFLDNRKPHKDILTKIIIDKSNASGFIARVAITPLDFAIINVAISKASSGVKIAVGSTPMAAQMANQAMAYISDIKNPQEENMQKCALMASEEIKCGTNHRASKNYRQHLIKTYVYRGLKKVIQNEG